MKKFFAILLASMMILSLCACGNQAPVEPSAPAEPAPAPAEPAPAPVEPSVPAEPEAPALDTELPVRIMSLNGTTGFGFAKLISDNTAGSAALNYEISVETDASNITAALISGNVDIAALPTNVAAKLFNKTKKVNTRY